VTRLGELSPSGPLFTKDSFFYITEVAHFWATFSMFKVMH
jgi:hypothetical protein